MLLQFTVGNYRSFREKTTFSLVAEPKERGHENSLLDAQKATGVKAVSLGVLYGANASGKSNLLKAMATLRDLVTRGAAPYEPIPVDRFLLNGTSLADAEPTFFEIYFVVGEEMYCYGLECDIRQIKREWLRYGQDEKPLFDRRTDVDGTVTIENYDELAARSETRAERLAFVAEGTRENQTFFAQSFGRNIEIVDNLWDWFNTILVMDTTPHFAIETGFLDGSKLGQLTDFLRFADTGIVRIKVEPEAVELSSLPDSSRRTVDYWVQSNNFIPLMVLLNGEYVRLRRDPGSERVYVNRLRAAHADGTDNGTFIDWSNESDGTQRITALWESLFVNFVSGRVIVFDEIERSLHPELIRYLLEQWRQHAPPNTQLIFTTHNDNLLEDDFLRRDEVWFVSKDKTGASRMVSEVEYKPIEGVTRQRAYLDGMYGGIPNIAERQFHFIGRTESATESETA